MSLVPSIVFCVCAILIAAIVADRVLTPKVAWQDFIWKVTLAVVLSMPGIILLGNTSWPDGLVRIPVYQVASTNLQPISFDPISEAGSFDRAMDVELPVSEAPQEAKPPTTGPSTVSLPSDPVRVSPEPARLESIEITTPQTTSASSTISIPWRVLAWLVWLTGSLILLVRCLVGCLAIRKITKAATCDIPASWSAAIAFAQKETGLNSSLPVLFSNEVKTPMVVGFRKSSVLFPSIMKKLHGNDLRVQAALTHEATHVRRADPLWNLLLCVCVAIWWPIPMVHWMKMRMFWLRELLCDAPAAASLGQANYSESLLQLASQSNSRRVNLGSIPMVSGSGSFESRIGWILNLAKPVAKPAMHIQLLCVGCVFAALLGFTAIKLVPAQNSPEPLLASSLTETGQQESENSNLEAKNQCRGVVQTKDGQAVAGATVYLLKRVGNTLPTYPLTTKTNAQGQYSLGDIASGKYRIWAEGSGLTSLKRFLGGAKVEIVENQAEPVVKDITIKKACDYRVEIVAAETGTPIEGATIEFGWTDIERMYTTGMDGVAEINGLASNDWYFLVKADGYATFFKKAAPQELGSTTDLKFEMKPGIDVEIGVRDQYGEPVADAIVGVQYDNIAMAPNLIPYPSKTDAEGKFTIKGMPLKEKLRFSASKDGYRFAGPTTTLDGSSGSKGLEITGEKLPYGGDVVIEVVDEEGKPIAGATVKNPSTLSSRYRESKSDKGGKAILTNLYPHFENKYVIIKSAGKIPQRINVEPGPEGQPSNVKVTLKSGRTLRGALLTPSGEPSPKTRIYYNEGEHGDWAGGRVLTNSEGKFEIEGLPEKTTLTIYTPQQYEPINDIKIELDPLGNDTVKIIKMTPAAAIRVRAVDDATGEPIPEFNVRIGFVDREHRREGDRYSGGITSSLINPGTNIHGTKKVFRLGHQVAGAAYKVIVSADGYETETIQRMEAVIEAESEVVDVRLSKAEQ